ncbi:uncharacterized protein DMENIID0001_055180 [Sergentomyia squamirostris]
MTLQELKCFPENFFRAKILLKTPLPAVPIIENVASMKNCPMRLFGKHLAIDISTKSFTECGIFSCDDGDLCMKIRFPEVEGLRTGSDALVTLKCHPQERIVTQNHALTIALGENSSGRKSSSGSVLEGGGKEAFRSYIGLFRRSRIDGSFSEVVQRGSEVVLGEELMLRAQIKSEGGWNFTGMSDISLVRISQSGEVVNSVILVTPEGCINPSMRAICPENISYDPPRGQKLLFRAASFPEMLPGEELALNVRIFGCLRSQDCNFNSANCLRRRFKRSLENVQSEVTRISYRISISEGIESFRNSSGRVKRFSGGYLLPIFSITGLAIFCFGCSIALGVFCHRNFYHKMQ